jgi:hypothetical protein
MIGSSLARFATTKILSSLFAKERYTSTSQHSIIIPHTSNHNSGDIVMMPSSVGRDSDPSPAETRSGGTPSSGLTASTSIGPDTESQDQDEGSVSVTGLSGFSIDLSVCLMSTSNRIVLD